MTALLEPGSIPELVDLVRSNQTVRTTSASTKPRLSEGTATPISTLKLRGITEYDPAEFTFTAFAGTPLQEIVFALAERGQYLPFDPVLVESGSTLGGAVASGLSGPGRFRFGGVRDFILGVRFVDGLGRSLRLGSKVVKSAAGFDLPKFFTGSFGRFGILTELTFKVFPNPPARITLKLLSEDIRSSVKMIIEAGNTRWQPEALDIPPNQRFVYLRLAGPQTAIRKIANEILSRWAGEPLAAQHAESFWSELREFRWVHPGGPLLKVPLTPESLLPFCQALNARDDARFHLSAGGNVAFIALLSNSGADSLSQTLATLGLPAVLLRGNGPLWLGARKQHTIAHAVKRALDPHHKFPPIDN
jgi:glycolate oxidase FAD binding subunit